MANLNQENWEEEFDEKFVDSISLEEDLTPLFRNRSLVDDVKSFIRENFIPRERVEKMIEEIKMSMDREEFVLERINRRLFDLRRELLGKEEEK